MINLPFLSFRKNFVIGLDIGSNSIKMVQFTKREGSLHIVHTAMKEILGDASLALKELLKDVDIQKSRFHVAINCPLTMTRTEVLPIMPASELRDAIRFESKNFFPYTLDEAFWDFQVIGEVSDGGVRKNRVIVAASPTRTVQSILSVLDQVGIKPSVFVPAPLALQKIVKTSHPKQGQVQAVLDIGERCSELAIFSGGDLIFQRKLPVSGSDFTKSLTTVLTSDRGKLELSLSEAEQIKRMAGIPTSDSSEVINGKISTTQLASMIREPSEKLVNEISRCFDYYREMTNGEKVTSLLLFGGGAMLKGLVAILSKELGIEVRLDEASEGLRKGDFSHRFALAIGAAFSRIDEINLLPPEIKEKYKRTFLRATVQSIAIGVPLVLILVYIGMGIQLSIYEKKITAANAHMQSLTPQLETVRARKLAAELIADEPYWEDVLKGLGSVIPNDVVLTQWSKQGNTMTFKGRVVGDKREELLSSFMMSLEKGIFKNVKLVTSSQTVGKNANEFELTGWVD